jgi:hypothetical protein
MKHEICPECGKPWNENEIEFQVCDQCGFEDNSSAVISKLKRWGIVAIYLIVITFISAVVMVLLEEYLNVSASGARSFALCMILGGYYGVIKFIKSKKI